MPGYKDINWNNVNAGDENAGQALALAGSRLKTGASSYIEDTLNKRSNMQDENTKSQSAANTADIIEQIRAGKTPDRTGFYNGAAISDAKYGYEKDQIALGFKRAAEGRAIAAHNKNMAAGANDNSPELASAMSIYSDAVAKGDPLAISAARNALIKVKGGSKYYNRNFPYFKKDNIDVQEKVKEEAATKTFMKALSPPAVEPTVVPKPTAFNDAPVDLITPAVNAPVVASADIPEPAPIDSGLLTTNDITKNDYIAEAAKNVNPLLNTPVDNEAVKSMLLADSTLNGEPVNINKPFRPVASLNSGGTTPNQEINTTVETPLEVQDNKTLARDLADPKVQEKARNKVDAYTFKEMDTQFRTSTKNFEDGIKEGKTTIKMNNAKIKAAQAEFSRLDKIPMNFPKGHKAWGLMQQAKNAQSNIIAMSNTENKNISDSVTNAEKTRGSHLKEYKDQYTETMSNEIDTILAGSGTYKQKRDDVSAYIAIQRKAIPRDQQWKRGIVQGLVAKSVGSKEYRGLIKDEGSGAGNKLGGKTSKTTAGLEKEPFFDQFRDNSLDNLNDVASAAIKEYGQVNYAALEEAIKNTDNYDEDDYLFLTPKNAGGKTRTKSIDTGLTDGSTKQWETDVAENYKKIMNRSDDFKSKKANDGKKKATIEDQLRARIKELESRSKK